MLRHAACRRYDIRRLYVTPELFDATAPRYGYACCRCFFATMMRCFVHAMCWLRYAPLSQPFFEITPHCWHDDIDAMFATPCRHVEARQRLLRRYHALLIRFADTPCFTLSAAMPLFKMLMLRFICHATPRRQPLSLLTLIRHCHTRRHTDYRAHAMLPLDAVISRDYYHYCLHYTLISAAVSLICY